jgi:integration host factor subunit alpha
MSTLTKAELANEIVEKLGLTGREAKEIVDTTFEEVTNSLAEGEEVRLSGVGNFTLHEKKERPGRNPKTGEVKMISARRVVTFRPSQKMRDRVKEITKESIDDAGG